MTGEGRIIILHFITKLKRRLLNRVKELNITCLAGGFWDIGVYILPVDLTGNLVSPQLLHLTISFLV